MFNKKLIILLLLIIFCIGITLSSVSANDVDSNLTEINNPDNFLNTKNSDSIEEIKADSSKEVISLNNDDNFQSNTEITEFIIEKEENDLLSRSKYNYEINIESITVNKSDNSFKHPVDISYINIKGARNFGVTVKITDPNGKSSSYVTDYSQNRHYITITPSIVGKYTINIKAHSDSAGYTSNNPTAYITVVDPNTINILPNTNANTNNNENQENYDDYDDYDDYDYESPYTTTHLKAPAIKVKYKSKSYFKINLYWYWWTSKEPLKNTKIILKVWTGKKTKTYTLKTNYKGIAKFNTKKLKIGKHKVKITFKGKDYYKGKSIFSKIIVKKATKKTPTKKTVKKTPKKKNKPKLGSKQNPRTKVNYKYFKNHKGERNKYYKNYYYLNGALWRDDNKYNIGAGTFTFIKGKNPYA